MLNLESQQSTSTFSTKKIVAAVACTGCAVAAIALVGTSTSTSSSLVNIPASMSGSMIRTDTDGNYNMNLTFNKFEDSEGNWVVDAEFVENFPEKDGKRVVTVVNNVAVQESFRNGTKVSGGCYDLLKIPAANDIGTAFNNAQVVRKEELVDTAAAQMATCAPGSDMFAMTMFGTSFTGCGVTNGRDVAMKVFRPKFTSTIQASADADQYNIVHPEGAPTDCHRFPSDISMYDRNFPEQKARALAAGNKKSWPFPEERDLERDTDWAIINCLFVHGVGQTPSSTQISPVEGLSELRSYWGGLSKGQDDDNAGCSDSHYSWHHSKNWSFINTDYWTAVCDQIEYSTSAINLLFTHSMGGLVTAQAFAKNYCNMPYGYYPSQPPYYGSEAASFAGYANGSVALRQPCVFIFHNCYRTRNVPFSWTNMYTYTVYPGYVSLFQDNGTGINSKIWLHRFRSNNHWKADEKMCGITSSGLTTGTSAGLYVIEAVAQDMEMLTTTCQGWRCVWRGCGYIDYSCEVSWNDGMVDVTACELGHEHNDPYHVAVNHEDGTCVNSDGSTNATKPCNWFNEKQVAVRAALNGR